ncbi:MAG: DUF3021 domain-containing protein [Lachnospiraceae bacterium]|nr:DUF3021 domain-containing protein [Lachnospiraceae bacterium]
MELKNRFFINSLIGIIAGMIVGIIFWMLQSGNPEGRSFVLHIVMSGLHGLIPYGAATVYSIESWGLTKSTVVHATITLATILAIELPMKWFEWNREFAIMMVIYVIIYTLIWVGNYLYWKHTIKKINDELKDYRKDEV